MRESRTLGSVRAKAEWLSYSTIPELRRIGVTLKWVSAFFRPGIQPIDQDDNIIPIPHLT